MSRGVASGPRAAYRTGAVPGQSAARSYSVRFIDGTHRSKSMDRDRFPSVHPPLPSGFFSWIRYKGGLIFRNPQQGVHMGMSRLAAMSVVIVLLGSGLASAQGTSAIAGVVRDTSGAVLPGVTVEAASPA